MKTQNYLFLFLIIVLFSCEKKVNTEAAEKNDANPNTVVLTENQIKNASITMGYYEEQKISSFITASGKLEAPPQNLATISTPFAGFIKSTDLLQGMQVKKGQMVVELQHPDYIMLQENYLELVSQIEFLEAEYFRQQELAKDNINAQKSLQSAKSAYMMAKAKAEGLRARLKLMNLDITRIENGELSPSIQLFSPFDGFVTEVNVNLGKYVNPNDAIAKIVDTKHLHVELKIFEKDLFKLKKGQNVSVNLNGDQATRKAKVYLIGKEIAPDRSITIHCHLEKEGEELLPGMFLTAQIETNPEKVPVLPESAIVKFEGDSFLFLEESAGKYQMVQVKTGANENGMVQVYFPENITMQTKLVLTGAYNLLSVLRNGAPEF